MMNTSKRLSRCSTVRSVSSLDRQPSRSDLYWLVPALLLPVGLCVGIISHGFLTVSPTIHTEVCALGYSRCGNLSTCVAQQYVCDGTEHCENGADEDILACSDNQGYVAVFLQMLLHTNSVPYNVCNLDIYPEDCVCFRSTAVGCYTGHMTDVPGPLSPNITNLILDDNNIHFLNNSLTFRGLFQLSRLYISYNGLRYIKPGVFNDLVQLQWLMMTDNQLRIIEAGVLEPLVGLRHLDLSGNLLTLSSPGILYVPPNVYTILLEHNRITKISRHTFILAREAKVLLLGHNNISSIHPEAFHSLSKLVEIDLQHNKLQKMSPHTLQHEHRLTKLTLDHNPLEVTTVLGVLQHTQGLTSLGLQGIDLEGGNLHSITSMTNLTYIYFKTHRYCRYAPSVQVCQPKEDGISSLTNLLEHQSHRICIWVIATITMGGNLLVIVCRSLWQEESNIHALFIRHLCTADIMTGLYLLVIAAYDVILRDEYNRHALWWVDSWACTAAGGLGITASQVSVLVLAFIAFERYMSVAYPFRPPMVTYKGAHLILVAIWVTGLILAILPLTSSTLFGRFYSSTGVCYPLFLDAPRASGWEYSCFILLGINLAALVLVCCFYSGLFYHLRRTRTPTSRRQPARSNLTQRLMAIVFVYFLCLVPIIVTKILALAGSQVDPHLYAWLTVFVVPVNSAFNPLVYTVFTPYFCRQFSYYAKNRRESTISFAFSTTDASRRVSGNTLFSYMCDEHTMMEPAHHTGREKCHITENLLDTSDISHIELSHGKEDKVKQG